MISLERTTSTAFSVHSVSSLKKLNYNDWDKDYTCLDWCLKTYKNNKNIDEKKFNAVDFVSFQ